MKWKKDSYYDSIETIYKSQELKPIISLKNCITEEPEGCIPISSVSKRGLVLDVPVKKVIKFLRHYPSIFEEFTGPQYNLPWFKLTSEAIELHREEIAVYENHRVDILERLKRFILMSQEKKLPWKVIRGMQWYLGLPDKFLKDPESNLDSSFKVVEMEDGLQGLSVEIDEKKLSLLQKDVVKRGGEYLEGSSAPLVIPLYPSK
ncbi:WHAT'S THIS FACTOR 9 protein, partial [Thalictrum thalictroides]